jgi:hypothetical protein
MRGKVLLLVLGLIVVGGVSLYATDQSRFLVGEHGRAQFVSLRQTEKGLDTLEQAGQNAVTVALDSALFRNIGSALIGQKIVLTHRSLPGETLTVTIDSLTVSPQPGRFFANLGLTVKSDKRFFSVGLDVASAVYFSGVSQVSPATADRPAVFSADFKLLPLSIEPKITFGFINISGRGFVSDIISGNVVTAFSDKLKLSVPYQPQIRYTLDENKTFEEKFGEDNKGTLKYSVSHVPMSIERWVHVVAPIFSNRGILLAAVLDEQEAKPFDSVASNDPIDPTQISQLEQRLTERAADAEKYFSTKQLTININTGALASVTHGISDGLRKLSLTLASTEVSGRIFDKRWSDNILGDGGFYAEAAGGDRVHGSVSVQAANFNYLSGKGLEGTLSLLISADADIHVHVDPLIGGGVGTTVKLKGSSNPAIGAQIGTSTFRFEDAEVALLAPILTCTAADIKVETDGKFKLGSGWATVPTIGVITGELIGADTSDPTIVFGMPIALPVLAKSDTNASDQIVVRDGLYLTLNATNVSFEAIDSGYRLASDFSVRGTNQAPDLNDRIRRLTAAAKEYWRNAMKPACPQKPGLRVLVGDLEFGPNNEIIKFIRNAWNDITKGPGKENEIVKLLDRVNGAAKNYDEATKKLANEIGDAAKNAFPKNNDIGRAAGEAAKSAAKAVTNPVGAAKDLGHQILCGFC